LEGLDSVFEHDFEFILKHRSHMVDLTHLNINQIQQLFELVLPLLQIGIHLLDLAGNSFVVILHLFQLMHGHNPLRVITIDLTTHTHRHITNLTKQFILILLMIVTVSKIQNGIVLNDLPIMLRGDLVLVVFIVALLAEIHLLSKTVHITFLVLTFLAFDDICLLMLLLFEGKLDQVVR
jgi:hypothetical protein